jgi:thymidylate synthase ThyX
MKTTEAKIILDSKIENDRVTCFEVTYPYIVHPEVLRHRSYSFCSASLRAIPLIRIADQFFGFTPEVWRRHQSGMQPNESHTFTQQEIDHFEELYKFIMNKSKDIAFSLHKDGEWLAKEQVNRIIAPYLYITHIMQGTTKAFEHFFDLRCDDSAQYEVRMLAKQMQEIYYYTIPFERETHIPYAQELYDRGEINLQEALKISSARSARVSYYNHEGKTPTEEEDYGLAKRLYHDMHLSPFEFPVISFELLKKSYDLNITEVIDKKRLVYPEHHYGVEVFKDFSGNLNNYNLVQFRKLLEAGVTV